MHRVCFKLRKEERTTTCMYHVENKATITKIIDTKACVLNPNAMARIEVIYNETRKKNRNKKKL
jgi:hypothetical protein